MLSRKQWAALMNLTIYRHYAVFATILKVMLSHHTLSHASQFGIAVNGKSHAKSGKRQSMAGVLNSAPNRKGKIMLITLQQFMVIALVNLFVWMLTGILAMHYNAEEIVLVSILMTIFGIVGFVIALVKE